MSRRILALFAKAPVPGQVKTRLSPPLSLEQAASLYEAMLLDILDQHTDRAEDLALWFSPDESRDWFRSRAPRGYRLIPQHGPDLPARMRNLFELHAREEYDRIVLRGSDSPTLPEAQVDAAYAALDSVDLVICPDLDGGYNLIGLRAPCDALFEIEMSTASVLDNTLARADACGLTHRLLPSHYDVDSAGDLARLRPDLDETQTPRTLAWLRGHSP